MQTQLDKEVEVFVNRYVECFTCLDLLVFFCKNPNTRETVSGLGKCLCRNKSDLCRALEFLVEKGVLSKERYVSSQTGLLKDKENFIYTYNPSRDVEECVKRFVDCMNVREKRLAILTALLKKGVTH